MHFFEKKLAITAFLLVLIESACIFLMYKSTISKNILLENDNEQKERNNDIFAVLIEQQDGSYKEYANTTWPRTIDGYEYNANLSGCTDKNGNVLIGVLNYNNGVATVESKTTTYCYLYFDIKK